MKSSSPQSSTTALTLLALPREEATEGTHAQVRVATRVRFVDAGPFMVRILLCEYWLNGKYYTAVFRGTGLIPDEGNAHTFSRSAVDAAFIEARREFSGWSTCIILCVEDGVIISSSEG